MVTDDNDWEWQQLNLRLQLRDSDGDAFEQLFQKFAGARWPGTFAAAIPMGPRGDLKCDGFESSAGCVFQCYGPRYGKVDTDYAVQKIDEDFRGAHAHWGAKMCAWHFVHGAYQDRLPAEVIRKAEDVSADLDVPYEIWGTERIVDMVRQISAERRSGLLGRAPTAVDMIRVSFEGISRVLARIQQMPVDDQGEHLPLPADWARKIEHNGLSPETTRFLELAFQAQRRVSQYMRSAVIPQERERMAESFRERYEKVAIQTESPNDAFRQMIIYAGGATGRSDIDYPALAVVGYFFSTCDIFERPIELETPGTTPA